MKEETTPGQVMDMSPEELKSLQEKTVKEKLDIIKKLNEIKIPLNVTVFSHGGPWTMRNVAFWNQMQKRDEDIVEFMQTYLTEQKG